MITTAAALKWKRLASGELQVTVNIPSTGVTNLSFDPARFTTAQAVTNTSQPPSGPVTHIVPAEHVDVPAPAAPPKAATPAPAPSEPAVTAPAHHTQIASNTISSLFAAAAAATAQKRKHEEAPAEPAPAAKKQAVAPELTRQEKLLRALLASPATITHS